MAKDTAKKNIKSNQVRLRYFLIITIAINIIWLIYPLFLAPSSPANDGKNEDNDDDDASSKNTDTVNTNDSSSSSWTLFQIIYYLIFWASQEIFAYRQLASAGLPQYDEHGNLQSCIDLSDPAQLGLLSYAQDLLWTCWGLQILTMYASTKFWYLYWLIPGVAVYKIFTNFIQPMLGLAGGALGGGAGGAQQQQGDAASSEKTAGELPQDSKSRLDRRRQELKGGRR